MGTVLQKRSQEQQVRLGWGHGNISSYFPSAQPTGGASSITEITEITPTDIENALDTATRDTFDTSKVTV